MRCNPGRNSYYICRLAHACACQTQGTNMVVASNAVSAYMSVLRQPKEGTIPSQWGSKLLPTDPHDDCNYN